MASSYRPGEEMLSWSGCKRWISLHSLRQERSTGRSLVEPATVWVWLPHFQCQSTADVDMVKAHHYALGPDTTYRPD